MRLCTRLLVIGLAVGVGACSDASPKDGDDDSERGGSGGNGGTGGSVPVSCPGNRLIQTQADIDRLAGCEQFEGQLIVRNATLTSLVGLESITRITESLIIEDNPMLESLAGLDNLESVDEYITIERNRVLASLHGFEKLARAGNGVGWLDIRDNPALESLDGLESLVYAGGSLRLNGNEKLASLGGLQNLEHVENDFRIMATNAENLVGLEKLASVDGILDISGNPSLASLEGLTGVTSVGADSFSQESMHIDDNPRLLTLGPLHAWSATTFVSDDGRTRGFSIRNNSLLPQCEADRFDEAQTSAICTFCENNTGEGSCE